MAPGIGGTASSCPKVNGDHLGCWSSTVSEKQRKMEPEIVTIMPPASVTAQHHQTISSPGKKETSSTTAGKIIPKKGPATSWGDQLLKKHPGKGGATVLWRPGSGRHVSEGANSYKPFSHIVRTLHLEDAIDVCTRRRIEPKNVVTFSSIDSRVLPPTHPCANLKVLWFSTSCDDGDENVPDWYGNVEFSVDAKILNEQWKYSFLVEMMTTPTHTTSRILLTNTDYSYILPVYNRYCAGGPWQVTSEGQFTLGKCSRFKFRGTNIHEHITEFMLEVTPKDEKKILKECQISFRNHEEAQDMKVRHVCNRYQRAGLPCPTPYSRALAASYFFLKTQENKVQWNKGAPKLSKSAQQYYQSFLEELKKQMTSSISGISLCS